MGTVDRRDSIGEDDRRSKSVWKRLIERCVVLDDLEKAVGGGNARSLGY
jgi:hypothetical protein